MKKMKLLLPAMMAVAILALSVGCVSTDASVSKTSSASTDVSVIKPLPVIADVSETGLKTVLVTTGTFKANENGIQGAPITDVMMTKNYYMGVYEVTQGQYRSAMGKNPAGMKSPKADNYPVESLTWYEAVAFCNALSMAENHEPYYTITEVVGSDSNNADEARDPFRWLVEPSAIAGAENGYRLPTEAEWEYAARGGQNMAEHTKKYAGSDEINDVAWYASNGGVSSEVGLLNPNALDIYDMSGNVAELCWDWLNGVKSYPQRGISATKPMPDPRGAASGNNRVRRGGSFMGKVDNASNDPSVAWRGATGPAIVSYQTGFRVVRTAEPATP